MSDIWESKLNMNINVPLYLQLEDIILNHIKTNNLKPGDGIPSEGEFCSHYSLSRSTVRNAFKQLEEKNLVIRRRGLGSFVSSPKVNRVLGNLYSFTSQMTEMGYETSSKVIDFEELTVGSEMAIMTGFKFGTKIYRIKRLRLANDEPMLLENTFILKDILPTLDAKILGKRSLYQLLIDSGVCIDYAIETYEPIVLSKEVRKILKCDLNPCAFFISRNGFTSDNTMFEFTQSYMSGQRSRLKITLRHEGMNIKRYE